MVTSNPLLKREESFASTGEGAMTLNGTVNKTGILLLICVVAAWYGWVTPEMRGGWLFVAFIAAFIFSLIGMFKPATSPVVAPAYAACEGLALGAISQVISMHYPGIAAMAVLATFSVLGMFLFLYVTRIVRVTKGMVIAVIAATAGIFIVYAISAVMGMFGHPLGLVNGNGAVGIGFSVLVCAIAAFNFFLDFYAIEGFIQSGAPKYMEWYSGMALLITIVWLYLEILRLLSKLQSRR
jgi:uncharacterized YccA/Bax inhibitor family protein